MHFNSSQQNFLGLNERCQVMSSTAEVSSHPSFISVVIIEGKGRRMGKKEHYERYENFLLSFVGRKYQKISDVTSCL